MKNNNIYLVSTPLHLYCASAIALSSPKDDHTLLFIDQIDTENNIYLDAVKKWSQSPFSEVHIFKGMIKNPIEKWLSRKYNFVTIKSLAARLKPDNVFVGNDRRIEFQYMMHCSRQYKPSKGIYFDEGIYTYLGRKSSQSFSDRCIDAGLKKISYGFWWKTPPTIGGSEWIADVYVAFPKFIHSLLREKNVHHLPQEAFLSGEISQLSENIIESAQLDKAIFKNIDALITLPHESVVRQYPEYVPEVKKAIVALKGKKIAYKPHPRDITLWYQELSDCGAIEIPKKANYEAIISLLDNVTVVGDFSSTLLMTKWLKPSMKIYAVKLNAMSDFENLYRDLGIKMIDIHQLSTIL